MHFGWPISGLELFAPRLAAGQNIGNKFGHSAAKVEGRPNPHPLLCGLVFTPAFIEVESIQPTLQASSSSQVDNLVP